MACGVCRRRDKQFGQAGGDRVNLDPGDSRTGQHVVGHEADEMPQAQRRFEHPALGKSEPAQGVIHGADHAGRGVMGVESSGAGRLQFLRREQLLQLLPLRRPLVIPGIEDLGQSAPPTYRTSARFSAGLGRRSSASMRLSNSRAVRLSRHLALTEPEPRQSASVMR